MSAEVIKSAETVNLLKGMIDSGKMSKGKDGIPIAAGADVIVTSVAEDVELLTRPKISPVTVPGVFPLVLVNENKKLSAVAGPKVAASSKTEPATYPMNLRYMITPPP